MQSRLTTSRKKKVRRTNLKKMAREVRGLRKELAAECREALTTLDIIAETLEGK